MRASSPIFISSGDLIADRRYEHARALAERGDVEAAADLMGQAVERAPEFASAWFALGELREQLGDVAGASEAYGAALAHDSEDRHGAALMLTLLRGQMPASAPGYVRALFDQYAPAFDASLRNDLAYRGPELLRDAVAATAGDRRFARMIDLGCGTGLMAEAMHGSYNSAVGIDLSTGMLAEARRKNLYDALLTGDMLDALNAECPDSADLIVAADSFCYVGDLTPLCVACARILMRKGTLAFTVEAHDGDAFVLQPILRYAHSETHVRDALDAAGLALARLERATTRHERDVPVASFIVVAVKLA